MANRPRFKPRSIVPFTTRYTHVMGRTRTTVYLIAGSRFPYTKGHYVL